MEKPGAIRDREREWAALVSVWESDRPELVFALGRRRVGKSFVLAPFCRAAGGVYFQSTRRSEADQLRELSAALATRFEDPGLRHGTGLRDWVALLGYLGERAGDQRFFVVLDEFPYLAESAPSLPSVLQRFVDHDLPRTRLKIVLAGSWISAMRRLEAADQPLYARRTARIRFLPFSYVDAADFVRDYEPADRLRTWGVFGGVPGHLALLDPEVDFATNVARSLLDPSSRLNDEALHHLDAFLTDSRVHYSILEAIAGGQHTWGGITKSTGKSSGSLSRPMAWLLEMEVVRRVVPVTEKRPERSKRALYRIDDPYVRFWHRFVAPVLRAGIGPDVSADRLYRLRIEPFLDDWMGPVFEEACRSYCRTGSALPFEPLVVGEWWKHDSSEQIDIVALSGEGSVLVGECKWGSVSSRDLRTLKRRAGLMLDEIGEPLETTYALFSRHGPADGGLKAAIDEGEVLHFSLEDLFHNAG